MQALVQVSQDDQNALEATLTLTPTLPFALTLTLFLNLG